MNIRQTHFAATLYRHAVVACCDCGGAETLEELHVMQRAIDCAVQALADLGYEPRQVSSLHACMQIAAGRKHNHRSGARIA